METENECTTAAPGDWDQALGNDRDGAVSLAECAPAVGAEEVVCPGEASQGEGKRRGGKRRQKQSCVACSHPEEKKCCGCRMQFERQGRGFNRRAVCTFTTVETVHWALPHATELHEKSFLCETCAQLVRSKCRKRQIGKRAMWVKPVERKQTEPRAHTKVPRMGKKARAAMLVSKSCYKAAFRVLWSAKGARKPMMDFLSKQLKVELKALSRQADSPFHQKVASSKPLAMFPWRRCLNFAQEKAPLVTHCIRAMFPDMAALSKSSHQLSEEQARAILDRRAVTALSIPLFTRNVYKNNFLQASLGAELRLQGLSGSGLDALNAMGLCQNKDTVRLLLLRLMQGRRKRLMTNSRLGQRLKQEQLKAERAPDVEEEEEGEEEEEEEEESETESESEPEPPVTVELEEAEDDEEESKRKKTKKKKKRKHRREEDADEEGDDENKKGRVVVVRLGLLHGHSDP